MLRSPQDIPAIGSSRSALRRTGGPLRLPSLRAVFASCLLLLPALLCLLPLQASGSQARGNADGRSLVGGASAGTIADSGAAVATTASEPTDQVVADSSPEEDAAGRFAVAGAVSLLAATAAEDRLRACGPPVPLSRPATSPFTSSHGPLRSWADDLCLDPAKAESSKIKGIPVLRRRAPHPHAGLAEPSSPATRVDWPFDFDAHVLPPPREARIPCLLPTIWTRRRF